MTYTGSFEEKRRRLVEKLVREGYIRSERVKRAMLRVPRELFVPEELRHMAYEDTPLPIGHGQTISAPHMVAMMTEFADLEPGMRVLEIGAGSGYHAAVIAEVVAPSDLPRDRWGHVYTVERIPELAEYARRNLDRAGYADRVTVILGDGTKGYPPAAPYDRIIVTAAAPEVPKPLLEQLKPGGKIVIPIGDRYMQYLYIVEKLSDGRIKIRNVTPCLFVPLIGEYGWREYEY
ncbi:protein-L-isoaspartate O-methyltransferase [Pyrodictium delaneyi]|uniref:Protein-L-isoaspartate O-methyltransferase n=1 Tax=Pyrodictium delaneyi TaxID=1273541 RepID=A0A211YPC4_9CREN|nr:protein-L-isoaspartate O-methyltransferase [Pyrodictium delaneyi]OWJ54885.1 protein-L-isoaspartate O-methyltransferase [Pyrodictium delaneyi]